MSGNDRAESENNGTAMNRFETTEFQLAAGTLVAGLAGYWSEPNGPVAAITLTAIVAGLALLAIVEWEVRHAD